MDARYGIRCLTGILTVLLSTSTARAVQVTETEPSDSPIQAVTLEAGDYGLGTANGLGDEDYWRMRFVDAGSSLYVLVDTRLSTSNIADADVTVFGPDGVTQLAYDDNSGPFFGSALANVMVPESGSVFLRVRELSDGELDDYLLVAAALRPDAVVGEQEPNNSPSEASGFTGRAIDSVVIVPDDDYYALPAVTGDFIAVILDDDPQDTGSFTDTELIIYEPDGTTIRLRGDNFEENKANATRTFTADVDGTYYARVTNAGGGANGGHYRIMGLVNGIPIGGDDPAGVPCDTNCPGQEPEEMGKGCTELQPPWWGILLLVGLGLRVGARRLEADR